MRDKKIIVKEPAAHRPPGIARKQERETVKEPPYRGLETDYIPRRGG
ncbi:hypothetical protein DCCM_2022 [Desulfocucumis palustris]|uniref:Uncharacterized protein n=1 Tax=Desulfocucumis palustris TaxID=1898651 RepID=A0A2L2X9P9_9FIRM|nr:hypothetical protein [Desulfocucumis palustris]GBF32925.1 hypothetical protein DCCM_2022 [Desulfocucumis palustris]